MNLFGFLALSGLTLFLIIFVAILWFAVSVLIEERNLTKRIKRGRKRYNSSR